VLPSQANFLTVRFDDAGAMYQRLFDAGIVVRDVRRYPELDDALRITVGTPAENEQVLAALARGKGLSGGAALLKSSAKDGRGFAEGSAA
jgi:histidinol-phosphate aminotransferase